MRCGQKCGSRMWTFPLMLQIWGTNHTQTHTHTLDLCYAYVFFCCESAGRDVQLSWYRWTPKLWKGKQVKPFRLKTVNCWVAVRMRVCVCGLQGLACMQCACECMCVCDDCYLINILTVHPPIQSSDQPSTRSSVHPVYHSNFRFNILKRTLKRYAAHNLLSIRNVWKTASAINSFGQSQRTWHMKHSLCHWECSFF